jgi:mono/diheme cytochrome c family protein
LWHTSLPRPAVASDVMVSWFTRVGFVCLFALTAGAAWAHDVTTHVTWNREVSRIVFARCAACHRPGGTAFSMLTYSEASPWAKAIKESVLQRSMPPWGAVKGFGSFRNDQSLTQEELDLFEKWVNGGAPEGNPNDLPSRPKILLPAPIAERTGEVVVTGEYRFEKPFAIDGVRLLDVQRGSTQVTIAFPDGRIEPLIWLYGAPASSPQPFLLRSAIKVPAGAVIRGVPTGSRLALLPPDR